MDRTGFTPGIENVRALNVEGYDAVQLEQRFEESGPLFNLSNRRDSTAPCECLRLAALYQAAYGWFPRSLVGIEEPESAVTPQSRVAWLEAMDEASLTTQVLATSHSA